MSNNETAPLKYPFDCLTDFVFVPEEEILPSDIILIPGGSHTIPMTIASEYYHKGLAPYLLPSGGYNSKIRKSEWSFLRDIALTLGVPEDRILKEDQAKNTFDNARNSLKVIMERKLEVKRAIIVCKAYFSRRALMTYQAIFPPSVTFLVKQDESTINKHNWYYDEAGIKTVMTEAEKIAKYFGRHIPRWVKQGRQSE